MEGKLKKKTVVCERLRVSPAGAVQGPIQNSLGSHLPLIDPSVYTTSIHYKGPF